MRRILTADRRHLTLLTKLHWAASSELGTIGIEDDLTRNLSTLIDDPRACTWISSEEESVIGFVSVSLIFELRTGWSVDLQSLYVVPEARGKGHSRALLEKAFSWAKEQEAGEVRIVCTSGNKTPVERSLYYRHIGFRGGSNVTLSYPLE